MQLYTDCEFKARALPRGRRVSGGSGAVVVSDPRPSKNKRYGDVLMLSST